jgi:GTPase
LSVFQRQDDDGVSRGARALVVLPDFKSGGLRSVDARLDEAAGLAAAIGIDVIDKVAVRIRDVRPATLFGKGQLETLSATANAHEVDLVIVDSALTPVQQKNLETAFKAKVIDRTGLILEIFGERAASAEGRLQVELAHLDYQAGRLWLPWWSWRNPNRGGSAHDPGPDGEAAARTGGC